jgi:hypothetical protein
MHLGLLPDGGAKRLGRFAPLNGMEAPWELEIVFDLYSVHPAGSWNSG